MSAKTRLILFNAIGLVVALYAYGNLAEQPLSFNLLGMALNATPGLLVVVAYVAGAVIGTASMIPLIGSKGAENVAKLKEWQEQDAKLAVEVQSDKEKQLEAKIATLESALKKALQK
jgi:hypothetical protein